MYSNHLNVLCTFCGPWAGVWLVSRVLLVSWRTLLEPPVLYFFPRRRLTKNSLEELLTRDGLDCLVRMSLFHFWPFNKTGMDDEKTIRANKSLENTHHPIISGPNLKKDLVLIAKWTQTVEKFLHSSCLGWVSSAPGSPCCVFCSFWASLLKHKQCNHL